MKYTKSVMRCESTGFIDAKILRDGKTIAHNVFFVMDGCPLLPRIIEQWLTERKFKKAHKWADIALKQVIKYEV